MNYQYSLRQEISQNKIVSSLYLLTMLSLSVIPCFIHDFYVVTPNQATSNIFFTLGYFVLPTFSGFIELKILSAIYEKGTYEFIQSTPISFIRLHFIRFLQLLFPMYLLFLLVICSGWADTRAVVIEATDYTLHRLLYYMSVNFFFIACLSLLLITISKSMFCSSMAMISYLLFDYFLLSSSNVKMCLAVTNISYEKTDQLVRSRNIFFSLSLLFLLAVLFLCIAKDHGWLYKRFSKNKPQ